MRLPQILSMIVLIVGSLLVPGGGVILGLNLAASTETAHELVLVGVVGYALLVVLGAGVAGGWVWFVRALGRGANGAANRPPS